MSLSSLFFLIEEAAKSVRRNGIRSFAALSAVTIALSVLGGSLFGIFRLHQFVAAQPERIEIAVFLRTNVSRETAEEVERRIANLPGVAGTSLVPKEEALARLMEQDRRQGTQIAKALGGANPLPDRIDVRTSSPERSREVAAALRNAHRFPEIECVRDEGELLNNLLATSRLVRTVGALIAVLLFFATAVLIQNTLRLTVVAREGEIRTMRLVGASPAFIRLPIVFEGIFYGVAGALLAGVIVLLVVSQASRFVGRFQAPLAAGVPAAPGPYAVLGVLLATGFVLGIVTSAFAIRRYLR
jgi:cell division transport system permease protein